MNREKRPPINISELTGKRKEEASPGEISYVRTDINNGSKASPLGSKVSKKYLFGIDPKALIVILISLILSVIIITSYAPSKTSVVDEISRFETAVAAEVSKVQANSKGTESQRIENLIQTVDRLAQRIAALEKK